MHLFDLTLCTVNLRAGDGAVHGLRGLVPPSMRADDVRKNGEDKTLAVPTLWS
jgi:hypothetical protein